MKPNRPTVALLSIICSLPCALLTFKALWLFFFATRTRTVSEDILELGVYALWFSPLATLGLVLAFFARGFKIQCFSVAFLYFVGWVSVIVAENAFSSPEPIILSPSKTNTSNFGVTFKNENK